MPAPMQRALDAYHSLYGDINKPRKLNWAPSVGQVTVTLKFESGEAKDYTVTTMQAALLGHFGNDDERTLTQLARAVGAKPEVVRRRLNHW